MDTDALKSSWDRVVKSGDEVPLFFYSHLFLAHPQLRSMFPVSMSAQRDKLVGALGHIVSRVDDLPEVAPFIQQLGRDHRRFSVVADHYSAVGASLLATLREFLGAAWTDELAADWAAAYGVIAKVMVEAAEASEETSPAWWDAEVVSVDRRTVDVSVIRIRPQREYSFRPGQSFSVEVPQRPRLWRYYTPANAPRENGTIDLHVQRVDGGQVSAALMRAVSPGDTLKLGSPVGEKLTLDDADDRDLVMVAGGTGLSPFSALLEQVEQRWLAERSGPQVRLFHGATHAWNLYERARLQQLAASRPWFEYAEVVSDDPSYPGEKGLVGSAAAASDTWRGRLALVCGGPPMVEHTVGTLTDAGMAREDIRYEEFHHVETGEVDGDRGSRAGEFE